MTLRQRRTRGPALVGLCLLGAITLLLLLAPWLATGEVARQHPDLALAPPSMPSLGSNGVFIPRRALVERLPPTYREMDEALPLRWFEGRLVTSADVAEPLLPLGSDSLGRDQWARLLYGGRLSLGLALAALAGAALIGTLVGLVAGAAGGWVDVLLMRAADLFIAWPALYVILVFRAAMPLSLSPTTLFGLMAVALALAGWPVIARPVRARAASEIVQEYILAARAAGATPAWMLRKHLLPAVLPVLATQALLLLPAFILAEAMLSFVGLGFADPTPSWGTMLAEASNLFTLRHAPWLLSPAVAIALVSLGANLLLESRSATDA